MDTGLATDGTSFEAIASVLEGLYQLDGAGNTIPGMAVKEEISEDGKVHTFTLRDAKWSDGQPVTANDLYLHGDVLLIQKQHLNMHI